MTTDPADRVREDIQRRWDHGRPYRKPLSPDEHETWNLSDAVVSEMMVAVSAASEDAPQRCGHSSDPMCCPFENLPTVAAWFRDAIAQESETPAATRPAAPSAGADVSGVSVDAGTVASVVEQAVAVISADCARRGGGLTTYGVAQALADAGLLADPDEVRRLLRENAALSLAARRAKDDRDHARDVAAALEAECARLSEALEDLRVSRPPGRRQYIIDRALSGEEHR